MITYATTSHVRFREILTSLGDYWTLKYSGTNASDIALEMVKYRPYRTETSFKQVPMKQWRQEVMIRKLA